MAFFTAIAAIGTFLGGVGAVAGAFEQAEARKEAAQARAQARNIQKNLRQQEARNKQRQQRREARIRTGQIHQAAVSGGVSGGSSVAGATGSIQTQLAVNENFIDQSVKLGDAASSLIGQAKETELAGATRGSLFGAVGSGVAGLSRTALKNEDFITGLFS